VAQETWIVIADGARARIFTHQDRTPPQTPPLVPALDHDLVGTRLTDQNLESDRPGRTTQRTQRMRHGVDGEMDKHRHAQIELARAVAKELETARIAGVRSFVLVAPPRALGDLREACNDEVRALVKNELAKDLTRFAVHELVARLDEILPGRAPGGGD